MLKTKEEEVTKENKMCFMKCLSNEVKIVMLLVSTVIIIALLIGLFTGCPSNFESLILGEKKFSELNETCQFNEYMNKFKPQDSTIK